MNAMFAQFPTIGIEHVGWSVVMITSLFVAYNHWAKARRNFVGVPPVGELNAKVEALEKRVAHQEGETLEADRRRKAIHDRIDQTRKEIMAAIDALRLENKTDTENVHERVNQVLAAVSELRGELRRLK